MSSSKYLMGASVGSAVAEGVAVGVAMGSHEHVIVLVGTSFTGLFAIIRMPAVIRASAIIATAIINLIVSI